MKLPNKLLAVWMFFLSCSGCSAVRSETQLKPVWTTDLLQNSLYAARVEQEHKPPVRHWTSPELAFVGSKTLAVSFDDDEQTLMTNLDQLRHFHFRTIFVNAEDGKFKNRDLSWATIDGDSKLLPMRDGGFVVVAGERLYRYSGDFKLITHASVPPDPGNDSDGEFGTDSTIYVSQLQHWLAKEDPAEESIVLCHAANDHASYFWIDDESLQILNGPITSEGWSYAFSVSGKSIIQGSLIVDHSGKWEPFCPKYKNGAPSFVSDNKVFIAYNQDKEVRYSLVTDGCKQLLDLPGGSSGTVDARAASGNRIAISESSLENTPLAATFTINVRIWDLDPPREVMKLSLTPKAETGRVVMGPAFAAALSSDGKLLAILLGSKLMLYSI